MPSTRYRCVWPPETASARYGKATLLFEQGGQNMPFHVVNPGQRDTARVGDGLPRREPHQQRADQSGSAGDRHPLNFRQGNATLCQRFLDHHRNRFQVFARGEFRHDTAVFGVNVHLRGDDTGKHLAAVAHDRRGGFVTGRFDAEQEHEMQLSAVSYRLSARSKAF